MRTLLTIIALCVSSLGQTTVLPKTTIFPKTSVIVATGSGGSPTISVVQHTVLATQVTCGGGTCPAFTVTTTGSGHAGLFGISTGTAAQTISSISCAGATCAGWQTSHSSPVCQGTDSAGVASTDIAYYPALPSGITSITVVLSGASPLVDMEFVELANGTGMSFDTCGNRTNTPASANYAGVALTLTGTTDYILQVGRPSTGMTACSAGWTDPADFTNGDGYCGKLNTASGTAVTWTATSSTAALSAIALKAN